MRHRASSDGNGDGDDAMEESGDEADREAENAAMDEEVYRRVMLLQRRRAESLILASFQDELGGLETLPEDFEDGGVDAYTGSSTPGPRSGIDGEGGEAEDEYWAQLAAEAEMAEQEEAEWAAQALSTPLPPPPPTHDDDAMVAERLQQAYGITVPREPDSDPELDIDLDALNAMDIDM